MFDTSGTEYIRDGFNLSGMGLMYYWHRSDLLRLQVGKLGDTELRYLRYGSDTSEIIVTPLGYMSDMLGTCVIHQWHRFVMSEMRGLTLQRHGSDISVIGA